MPSRKQSVMLRLNDETFSALYRLHPSYGEASGVVRQLVEAYVTARKAGASTVDALADSVLGRVRG